MEMTNEDIVARMLSVHHRVMARLNNVAAFDDWAWFEVFALRAFVRSELALSTKDLMRVLGCSWPHASRVVKRLRERGFLVESRWHQYRSFRITPAGEAFLAREQEELRVFADDVLRGMPTIERRALYDLLGRIKRNVDGS